MAEVLADIDSRVWWHGSCYWNGCSCPANIYPGWSSLHGTPETLPNVSDSTETHTSSGEVSRMTDEDVSKEESLLTYVPIAAIWLQKPCSFQFFMEYYTEWLS